jgi:hypothetical protein
MAGALPSVGDQRDGCGRDLVAPGRVAVQHRLRRHADFGPGHGQERGPVAAPEARCLALGTSLREVEVETWDAIRSRRNVPSYLWRAGGRALSELP